MNQRGEKPYSLGGKETAAEAVENVFDYENVVGQDDLTRFDKKRSQNATRQQRVNKTTSRHDGGRTQRETKRYDNQRNYRRDE